MTVKERLPISMTSDFRGSRGVSPEGPLSEIADAGFGYVHWCHEWNTDHNYTPEEVAAIDRTLYQFNLRLLDTHGSDGKGTWQEAKWIAGKQEEQTLGVQLVQNRLKMTADLGGRAVVMHVPAAPGEEGLRLQFYDRLHRAFDRLTTEAISSGVMIAFENLETKPDNFPTIRRLLNEYGPEVVGVCYDSGHGNIQSNGLNSLMIVKERLVALHLHDNHGWQDDGDNGDEHMLPFAGTIDWESLASVIADSSYDGIVTLETGMGKYPGITAPAYLAETRQKALRVYKMIKDARK